MVQPKEEYNTIESYTIARYKNNYLFKLDMNENTLGCSPHVTRTLQALRPDTFSIYPTYGEIEEKIARFFNIDASKVVITNGGDAGINGIYYTYVDENDEVLYAVPTYVMYKLDAQRMRAKIVQVPYEQKWVYPTDQVIAAITDKTRLIVIPSPANPTGDVVSEEDICEIAQAAPHAMVLLDEAYWRFTKRENKSLYYLIDRLKNITIMHTFSKDYGLAGIRIGYLLSSPENITYIRKSMDPFAVNNIAVEAAKAALDDQVFVQNYVNKIAECRDYFSEAIKVIADEVYDSHANFILFHVGKNYEWYHSKLLKKKVKIRRYPNNPLMEGYIRLTLGTVDQMQMVLNFFKNYDVIVFDIDGVLVDESVSYRKTIQATYEHFTGRLISLEEIQDLKNQGGFVDDWKLSKHLLDRAGLDVPLNNVIDKFQEIYFNDGKGLIANEKLLIDPEKIKKLREIYKLAVFTGRPRPEAEFILKKEDIFDCFDVIVSADDVPVGQGKPDPYGLKKICNELNTWNILYIGDMPDDIMAAESTWLDSVGILPPQDKSDNLKQLLLSKGAIEVYNNLDIALEKIFGTL